MLLYRSLIANDCLRQRMEPPWMAMLDPYYRRSKSLEEKSVVIAHPSRCRERGTFFERRSTIPEEGRPRDWVAVVLVAMGTDITQWYG